MINVLNDFTQKFNEWLIGLKFDDEYSQWINSLKPNDIIIYNNARRGDINYILGYIEYINSDGTINVKVDKSESIKFNKNGTYNPKDEAFGTYFRLYMVKDEHLKLQWNLERINVKKYIDNLI